MSGPGPKDPPFFQEAEGVAAKGLAAVAHAIGLGDTPAAADVKATVATVAQGLDVGLVEAVQKMHAAEIAAVAHVQALGSKVSVIMKRFVGNASVDAARAKLEAAMADFENALKAAAS